MIYHYHASLETLLSGILAYLEVILASHGHILPLLSGSSFFFKKELLLYIILPLKMRFHPGLFVVQHRVFGSFFVIFPKV